MTIVELNQYIYEYLKSKRDMNKKLVYVYRKGNYGGWLDLGHWFYGNDEFVAISFWSGMDWKNKIPNIIIKITSEGQMQLEVHVSDSDFKRNFVKKYLSMELDIFEENGVYYKGLLANGDKDDIYDVLDVFLSRDKERIDNIIKVHRELEASGENNEIGFIDRTDFFSRERKIKQYQEKLDDTTREMNMLNSKPYKIKSFYIQNYGPLTHIEINNVPIENQWIFITGENGTGKTNILRALGATLGYKKIDSKNKNFQVKLELYIDSKNNENMLRENNENILFKRPKVVGLCMYGPFRLINSSKLSRNKFKTLFHKAGTFQSLFSDCAPLLDLEQQFSIWQAENDSTFNKRLYHIQSLLTDVVPGLYDIRFEQKDGKGKKYTKYITRKEYIDNEIGVTWEHLSSGTKNVFSLLVDILLRLYEQQPKVIDPAELKGIVLIDEIDLHLHPKAQKELIVNLSNIFRNVQFIATTHSPIPFLGLPRNSRIYVVKSFEDTIEIERMDEKVLFSRISPNALLSSPIFDFYDLVPSSKEKNEIPYFEDNFSEVKYSEFLTNNIDDFLNNTREKELIELFSKKGK